MEAEEFRNNKRQPQPPSWLLSLPGPLRFSSALSNCLILPSRLFLQTPGFAVAPALSSSFALLFPISAVLVSSSTHCFPVELPVPFQHAAPVLPVVPSSVCVCVRAHTCAHACTSRVQLYLMSSSAARVRSNASTTDKMRFPSLIKAGERIFFLSSFTLTKRYSGVALGLLKLYDSYLLK